MNIELVPIYNGEYTRYQMDLDIPINVKTDNSIDPLTALVLEFVQTPDVLQVIHARGRIWHGYAVQPMLAAVLLAAALCGKPSVREMAKLARFDIRFIHILQGKQPSKSSFHRFLGELKPDMKTIFYLFSDFIETKKDQIPLDLGTIYIDGTKYEACANKFTFIWKKSHARYMTKFKEKAARLITDLNVFLNDHQIDKTFSIITEPDPKYLAEIAATIARFAEERNIEFVYGRGHRKSKAQKLFDWADKLFDDSLRFYIQHDLLDGKNSCSKTDPDAAFLHMKYDYYCNTGVFKPGYNIQFGVSSQFIREIYVSTDANDMNTFIPFMEAYKAHYGDYPKKAVADAGYGSYDNYTYCFDKAIVPVIKYSTYEQEKHTRSKKNRFKSYNFKRISATELRCPGGQVLQLVSCRPETRQKGRYPRLLETYATDKCAECPLRSQCTKSKTGRKITQTAGLEEYHETVREILASEEGKELKKQRSIQAEGTFGQLKQDHDYDRLSRIGKSGVEFEIYLVALGHNIRKLSTLLSKEEASEAIEEPIPETSEDLWEAITLI